MTSTFINEADCYAILNKYGIATPHYVFLKSEKNIFGLSFKEGQSIVLKAVVDEVWHKSDLGLVTFSAFSNETVAKAYNAFKELNPHKEHWRGLLVCEKVSFKKEQLPGEILLSIKKDDSCGPVVTLGFGGIYTELWGKELKGGVLNFPVKMTTVDQAFAEISGHLLGKILLGNIRQGEQMISLNSLKRFLTSVWTLADNLEKESLSLIEMNPLVVGINGNIVAIDGVGEKAEEYDQSETVLQKAVISEAHRQALFDPRTFLIAGVSSKKKAFGNIVLDNLKRSDIPAENILIVKPGSSGFEGFRTIDSLSELSKPVDVLVLAVPAQASVSVIEEVCVSGMVRIIYLVAGGIGDGADHSGLKERLLSILNKCDSQKRPLVVGPNSLGIILSPLKVNTLFIPQIKLPVTFYPEGNIGLIAQSGAFFITRISRNSSLPVRYGFCIGNQLDISATDLLESMAKEPSLDVVALYLEGAPQGDALGLAEVINKISQDKKVIIYRGGRSTQGMKAAAGHTGALATNYSIEKKLLQNAGALVCESFDYFENALLWYSAYPAFKVSDKKDVAVISNAGYESVASADGIGDYLTEFTDKTNAALKETLFNHKLSEIVTPANPLDITPMASDKAYVECSRDILQSIETGLLIMGVVPLSVMIESNDSEKINTHVDYLKELVKATGKPLAIVIDAGKEYLKLKEVYLKNGIPVLNSIQGIFNIIK